MLNADDKGNFPQTQEWYRWGQGWRWCCYITVVPNKNQNITKHRCMKPIWKMSFPFGKAYVQGRWLFVLGSVTLLGCDVAKNHHHPKKKNKKGHTVHSSPFACWCCRNLAWNEVRCRNHYPFISNTNNLPNPCRLHLWSLKNHPTKHQASREVVWSFWMVILLCPSYSDFPLKGGVVFENPKTSLRVHSPNTGPIQVQMHPS